MFSKKMIGEGIAIEPAEGILYAPADGTIVMTTATNHAIGLKTNDGIELLIHVGIDTVSLNGEYMRTLVNENSFATKGTPLLSFDLDTLKAMNIDMITPVIVTNTNQSIALPTMEEKVSSGDYLFSVE
ncbi:PTS sugar transporter subunit IIA [Enterococcus sp. LJL99]